MGAGRSAVAILAFLILLSSGVARASTLVWDPVTTYTDGSRIEATKVVTYNLKANGIDQGNIPCNPGSDGKCEWAIPGSMSGHGATFTAELQTKLDSGEVSEWSVPFDWTFPAGVPAVPAGIGVR